MMDLEFDKVKYRKVIHEKISEADLYGQLAEEAAELAQAASKMERVLRGTNPTPKSKEEVMKNLIEEYTDLLLVSDILGIGKSEYVYTYKLGRWKRRLEGKE